jgi:tRNA threonylcarbamoyladenosine biosynthesis protein TsaB
MSGLLLALETSGDVCGIALNRDGQLLSEHTFRHGMHLSERLMGEVDAVLRTNGAVLADIAAFAVGVGPGSFTGTRIGVMTVKTFAAILERPVYGVSSLEALAAPYTGLRETILVPMLPCRSSVVFTCPYSVESAMPAALAEPAALSLAELAERLNGLSPRAVHFCGSVVARYREELETLLPNRLPAVSFGQPEFPAAAQVARLADFRRTANLPADDALALVPRYISPPPITLPKQPIPPPITTSQAE